MVVENGMMTMTQQMARTRTKHLTEKMKKEKIKAKKRREEKRRMEAEGGEYQDYSPRPQYHQKSKESKPQECKYKCKTMLIWDNSIPDKNKFKEVETGIRHTYDRCLEIKNTTEKK